MDNDPMVLTHARALLTGGAPGATAYLDADLRDTGGLLEQAAAGLDFSQPTQWGGIGRKIANSLSLLRPH